MRNFLHKLMVDITRHPREIITPEWSKESYTHNVFRFYEYWFGRRAGIRFESGLYDGKLVFGTWEASFAYSETAIRHFLRKRELGFKIVKAPEFAFAGGGTVPSIFRFAIANDNSFTDFGTTFPTIPSFNYTCSGSNLTLLSLAAHDPGLTVTGVTYNSVAMTQDQTATNSYGFNSFHLLGPATGAHTYQQAGTSTGGYPTCIASYSGTSQTSIDSVPAITLVGSGNIVMTVNTATANGWGIVMAIASSGSLSAGTNTTLRNQARSDVFAGDSNGTIATGSFSMTINGSGIASGQIWKLGSVAGVIVNSGFFFAVDI